MLLKLISPYWEQKQLKTTDMSNKSPRSHPSQVRWVLTFSEIQKVIFDLN